MTTCISLDPLVDTKYKHVLLVDGGKECYYNVDNGNLYAKIIIEGSSYIDISSPLFIDYSSNKTKTLFAEVAKNEDWQTLYEHTKFFINLGDTRSWFSFQFIPHDQKYLAKSFAIITAFNPYMNSKDRTCVENFMANNELSLMLEEGKYHFLLSKGELSGYSEDSFIVYDMALEKALEVGRIFEQESIVYNNGKVVAIVDCETSKNIIELNHFEIYQNIF